MGKNQLNHQNTQSQSQRVREIFFNAVNMSSTFRSFRHVSSESPKFATTNYSATTKPKIDHRNYTAKSTISKPVALAQNGSTFSLELNCQKNPSQAKQNLSTASNMVLVEYNHISGDSATPKFKTESVKAVNKWRQQNEDPYIGEPQVNKSPAKNMFTVVHHEINEGPKDDNVRFSNYIDHVKNKMRIMSSFDDDKLSHRYIIDRSKFNTN
ncbi:uncharacterized protein LOC107866379 [Capsicum annuum]|uniref:uncharacterized protein LOC107866379 n=1 Tax=Capsicum annuum TaxID=4072 RepID=UPI001FB160F2|nr:uncharacterized protein LOC107866379 [Capsicum annuum]